jgi:hypothetical protein
MAQDLVPVELLAGTGGLNRMQNLAQIPKTDLAWVESLTVENITWQKMAGALAYNSAPLDTGLNSIWDFFNKAFVQEQIAWLADGRTVVVDQAGTIQKTLNAGTPPTFGWMVEGFLDTATKALFFYNGLDVPRVYANDGTTVTTSIPLASLSPDWQPGHYPTMAFMHGFRMVAVGGPDSHRAYLSSPRSHDRFAPAEGDSLGLAVYPGKGQKLVGGISFREKGYLFKYPRGIYGIQDSDSNIANWSTPELTDAVGMAGPGCICAVEDDVIFLDSDGYFHALSAVQTQKQETVPTLFSRETSDFIRTQVNLNALELTRSVYYSRKRLLIFAVPAAGSTVANRYLLIDYNLPSGPRLLWSSRDECPALALRRENKTQEPIIGDSTGYIWRLDRAARNKGGAGYRSQYEVPAQALIEGGIRRMNLFELEVVFRPTGEHDLSMEVHKMTKDGADVETLAFSMQTFGAPIGSMSFDPDVLAGTEIQTARRRLHGDANYLKLIGYNNNADENYSVMSHIVRGKPGRYA